MKITCFADEISPLLSDQLRVMEDLGIRWMDLRSCWDTPVLKLNRRQMEDIRAMAQGKGIGISCIGSVIGKEAIENPLEPGLEQLRQAAQAAQLCGCRYIRIFSYYPGQMDRAEALKIATERLSAMAEIARAEIARAENVVLVVESAKVTSCGTGRELARLLGDVASRNLKAVFDPAAFVAAGEDPFDQSLPAVDPWLEYVHIKDSRKGQKERFVAGEGDGQVAQVLNALRERNDLFLSLEPHLSYAGPAGGFSGEGNFRRAHGALIQILKGQGICYA